MNDTLTTIRELQLGEMRHRIVRRKRDNTYWYVRDARGPEPRQWIPMTVDNQSGKQTDAERNFARGTR